MSRLIDSLRKLGIDWAPVGQQSRSARACGNRDDGQAAAPGKSRRDDSFYRDADKPRSRHCRSGSRAAQERQLSVRGARVCLWPDCAGRDQDVVDSGQSAQRHAAAARCGESSVLRGAWRGAAAAGAQSAASGHGATAVCLQLSVYRRRNRFEPRRTVAKGETVRLRVLIKNTGVGKAAKPFALCTIDPARV